MSCSSFFYLFHLKHLFQYRISALPNYFRCVLIYLHRHSYVFMSKPFLCVLHRRTRLCKHRSVSMSE